MNISGTGRNFHIGIVKWLGL